MKSLHCQFFTFACGGSQGKKAELQVGHLDRLGVVYEVLVHRGGIHETQHLVSGNRVIHAVCRSTVVRHDPPNNSVRAVRSAASGARPPHRVAVSCRASDVDVSGRRRVPRAGADAFAIDGDPGLELIQGGIVRAGPVAVRGSRGVGKGSARCGAWHDLAGRNSCRGRGRSVRWISNAPRGCR